MRRPEKWTEKALFVMCCWSIPQYGEWQGWNLFQKSVKLLSAREVKQGVYESADGSKRADFWGMLILRFRLEMRTVIQNIWKIFLKSISSFLILSPLLFLFLSQAKEIPLPLPAEAYKATNLQDLFLTTWEPNTRFMPQEFPPYWSVLYRQDCKSKAKWAWQLTLLRSDALS